MIQKILICSLLLFIPVISQAKEPKNLDNCKQQLIQYHDSGEYTKDLTNITDKALLYIKNRLAAEKKSPSGKKLAIVLDIDETSLSNYPDLLTMHFGGTDDKVNDLEGKGTDPVIRSTLEIYQYAKENNIAVFFITGRYEKYRAGTEKNLIDVGYKNWDGLILKPDSYSEKSAAPYKISSREQIEKQGYTIILNMGDQDSDLTGKHAEKTFKLPNPFYRVP